MITISSRSWKKWSRSWSLINDRWSLFPCSYCFRAKKKKLYLGSLVHPSYNIHKDSFYSIAPWYKSCGEYCCMVNAWHFLGCMFVCWKIKSGKSWSNSFSASNSLKAWSSSNSSKALLFLTCFRLRTLRRRGRLRTVRPTFDCLDRLELFSSSNLDPLSLWSASLHEPFCEAAVHIFM